MFRALVGWKNSLVSEPVVGLIEFRRMLCAILIAAKPGRLDGLDFQTSKGN